MPGVKVTNFMGVAPKVSPELLPDTVAQVARNAKIYSGDLIPYPQPVIKANNGRNALVRTIHALRHPDMTLAWLSWLSDVDIVVATPENEQDLDQRYYYTGDGRPKVSNYRLSFAGPPPNPTNWYDLGLPLPEDTQVLTAVAIDVVEAGILNYARDNANTATIRTQVAHRLRTGNLVTITGFTYRSGTYTQSLSTITVNITNHGLSVGGEVTLNFKDGAALDGTFPVATVVGANTFTVTASNEDTVGSNPVDWDIRNFNATNAEVTVDPTDATKFTYFSPGPSVEETTGPLTGVTSTGKVSLAGNSQERKYVFTWLTPWEEESIGSEPSKALYIKEGQTVLVSNIPTVAPDGNYFIRGVNLYRTLPSAVETEYFLLQTLWFPEPVTSVSRTGGVARVTTNYYPHNLDPEDRFKLAYCPNVTFNGEFEVLDVEDQYTFTFTQAGPDVAETVTTGWVYHDVAELPTYTARYWGYTSFTFRDDFDSKALTEVLESDEYDAPPEDLRGLIVIQNNILAGYVGNTVYFSEPGLPHAWPRGYARVLEHNVVGMSVLSGSLIVLTDGYPYIIATNDPAAGINVTKIDALFPCVSGRGIVKLANAVAYPTNDGIAVYGTSVGSQLITKFNYNDDTWKADLDPRTIIAGYYNEAYFASHGIEPQTAQPDEPAPPAVTLPPPLPEPTDPVGGDDGGGLPEEPEPSDDPLIPYTALVSTSGWTTDSTVDPLMYGIWSGYVDDSVLTGVTEKGSKAPEFFVDGTTQLKLLGCRSVLGTFGGGGGPLLTTTSYMKIGGYASDPMLGAHPPLTITLGSVVVTFASRATYSYSGGVATWWWAGDPFGLFGTSDLDLYTVVRLTP